MKLKMVAAVAAACVSLTGSYLQAESPLAGNWKFNKEKSKLTGDTITFAPGAAGAVKLTSGGLSYTFKADGSDTPTPSGSTSAWTKVDEKTWREVVKVNGKTVATNTYMLSADGKTMNVSDKGTKPNGDAMNDASDYERMTGANGFMGKWKSTKVDANFGGYAIKDNGDGSLTWQLPDLKATLRIKPDGQDATPTGPTVPPGFTIALTKVGPRSFTMVEKMNGKAVVKITDTISADGKTFTERGSSVGVSEPFTSIYDKQ